jgi:hypothetical protein
VANLQSSPPHLLSVIFFSFLPSPLLILDSVLDSRARLPVVCGQCATPQGFCCRSSALTVMLQRVATRGTQVTAAYQRGCPETQDPSSMKGSINWSRRDTAQMIELFPVSSPHAHRLFLGKPFFSDLAILLDADECSRFWFVSDYPLVGKKWRVVRWGRLRRRGDHPPVSFSSSYSTAPEVNLPSPICTAFSQIACHCVTFGK